MRYLINGISLSFVESDDAFCEIAKSRMKRVVDPTQFHFCVYKKSIDARRRDDIRFVCSVLAQTEAHLTQRQTEKLGEIGFKLLENEFVLPQRSGKESLGERPLVVGCGPAGMFCALLLAENGYRPILIDRGGSVEQRAAAYDKFCREGVLSTENNIQYGAGGAGTFSDGKLTTRINDPRCAYVLSRLRDFGAPEDITVKAKPHIGTDILQTVVGNVIKKTEALGGEVRLNCRLDRIKRNADNTLTAMTASGDIQAGCIVLATGHSARDTYAMLGESGFELEPKPFSVGVRIEHLQKNIDKALFGKNAGDDRLGRGEYNFSDTTGRGVYTFCMCPGGEVVAAATEQGGVVVNGMSRHARDGRNANSAIAVTVNPSDYGATVDRAVAYQRALEKAAYEAGGGEYRAPIQTVGDFLEGKLENEPTTVQPTYRDGRCRIADIAGLFPQYITNELRKGIRSFGRRLDGFDAPTALLTGVETRTSSPIRILRNESLTAKGYERVYPCGEGAGYAGGITSAAVDGIRVATAIIERFAVTE